MEVTAIKGEEEMVVADVASQPFHATILVSFERDC